MSPTLRARFTPPSPRRPERERSFNVPVVGGLHAGLPPHALPLGFSPALQNLVPDVDGFVRPRSGLSLYASVLSGPALGAAELFDVDGVGCAVSASTASIAFLHPDNVSWSDLSYVPGTVASSMTDGIPSGTSTDYWRFVNVYDQTTNKFITIASNGTNAIKFFDTEAPAATYSEFTWADSLDSIQKAADLEVINNRLVFFGVTQPDGTSYPTRVAWTARGDPKDFSIAAGAGFEDLLEMRGKGTTARRFKELLILLTDKEIWRGTPTLDSYAFRFSRVLDGIGCLWPRTAVSTPNGIIFLGPDREFYITDGSSVVALGPVQGEGPSRVQRLLQDEAINLERSWAVYNQSLHRYEFYYATAGSPGGYPSRALYYKVTDRTWWKQSFSLGLSAGVNVADAATGLVIDEMVGTFDENTQELDAFSDVNQGNQYINVFTSAGENLRFRSDQTSDDGTSIEWRWRSPGFSGGRKDKVHLAEVWTDYENDSNSSASLFVGDARNAGDFEGAAALSLATPAAPIFTPTWKTETSPNFEIRGNDGGRPRLSGFNVTVKQGSKF